MLEGNLTLTVGDFRMASGDFAFDLYGVTALFGRSGSGKSTLLRAMSGLDRHTRGHLRFQGELWQDGRRALPPEQRDIGMVFQHTALLTHHTVRGNLDFAARRVPADRGTAIDRAAIVERTGIGPLLDRDVGSLSGGERQRVAIARALIAQPRVLMMDEPLAALDWRAKGELLELFETVIRELGIPTIMITHAPKEVERLADRVVFMADGQIERVETFRAALDRVDSPLFTEEGPVASLDGRVERDGSDAHRHWFVTTPQAQGKQPVAFQLGRDGANAEHGPGRLRICSNDVALALARLDDISIQNQLPARIERIEALSPGRQVVFLTLADGQRLISEVTDQAVTELCLEAGQAVNALVKSAALMR